MSREVVRGVEAYGDHPLAIGEWFVPGGDGPAPTVVLVHGGFWREKFDRHLEDDLAVDLASRGYLCWNIDYRSAADPWPATFIDVAAGYDHLFNGRYADRVDRSRLAVVGHSAGGHLAGWLASRHCLPPGIPGHNATVQVPTLCIAQAGVMALTEAAGTGVGRGAALALVGGTPDEHPDRYRAADPIGLLPTGVRTVLLHDRDDDLVPIRQSELYVAQATNVGDDCVLDVVPGNHFSHLKPKSRAAQALRDALATMSDR